jgi:hypothetical protein
MQLWGDLPDRHRRLGGDRDRNLVLYQLSIKIATFTACPTRTTMTVRHSPAMYHTYTVSSSPPYTGLGLTRTLYRRQMLDGAIVI